MTARAVVLVLASVALALRLLHVHAAGALLLHESADVGMDRWLAMRMGQAVAEGDWLGGWTADYDSAPGYGYWLGLLHWLSAGRWLPAVVIQAVLGAAVVPLVFAIGRRLASVRVGLVAASFAALYAPTIFYETLLVKFSLVPVAVAAVLLATDRARERGDVGRVAAAGLVYGLLVAVRGNAAVLLPVLVWWIAGGASRATVVRVAVTLVVAAATVLGPLAARDRIAAARGSAASVWGIHFYIASHPGADGTYAPVPGVPEDPIGHVVDARRVAEQATGRALSAAEVSGYWFGRGLAFARENPWHFVRLQARKVRLALAGFEEGTFGDDYADAHAASWVLRLPLLRFGTLCPLAVLGMLAAVSERRARLLPAIVGAYLLSLLLFFVTGRYRLPLVVPVCLLAAIGLAWLDDARRRGAVAALVGAGVAMLVVAVGLPGEPADLWTCAAVVAIGLVALAVAPATSSVREVAERAQPFGAVALDERPRPL